MLCFPTSEDVNSLWGPEYILPSWESLLFCVFRGCPVLSHHSRPKSQVLSWEIDRKCVFTMSFKQILSNTYFRPVRKSCPNWPICFSGRWLPGKPINAAQYPSCNLGSGCLRNVLFARWAASEKPLTCLKPVCKTCLPSSKRRKKESKQSGRFHRHGFITANKKKSNSISNMPEDLFNPDV